MNKCMEETKRHSPSAAALYHHLKRKQRKWTEGFVVFLFTHSHGYKDSSVLSHRFSNKCKLRVPSREWEKSSKLSCGDMDGWLFHYVPGTELISYPPHHALIFQKTFSHCIRSNVAFSSLWPENRGRRNKVSPIRGQMFQLFDWSVNVPSGSGVKVLVTCHKHSVGA